MINIDMTINLGVLVEIGVIGAGGIATITTLRHTVKTLRDDLTASKVDLKEDINSIQTEIRKLNEVVVRQAALDVAIEGIHTRLNGQESDIRELRHGEGFVRNRNFGEPGINREFP